MTGAEHLDPRPSPAGAHGVDPAAMSRGGSAPAPTAPVQHDSRRRAQLRASLLLEVAVAAGPADALVARAGGGAGVVQRRAVAAALRSLEREGLVVASGHPGGGTRYRLSATGAARLRRFGELLDAALRADDPATWAQDPDWPARYSASPSWRRSSSCVSSQSACSSSSLRMSSSSWRVP